MALRPPARLLRFGAKAYNYFDDWALFGSGRVALDRVPGMRRFVPAVDGLVTFSVQSEGAPLYARLGTSDLAVARQIFRAGDYAFGDVSPEHFALSTRLYEDILRRGRTPIIVDCGANAGYAAVYLSSLYPRARVVAVEPSAANYSVLVRNAASRPQIDPVRAAVSDRAGTVKVLEDDSTAAWAVRTAEGEGGGDEVPAVPIVDLFARVTDGEPFFVKVDIEGAEATLFRSDTDWVARTPIISVETHDWMLPTEGSSSSTLRCLADGTREIVVRGENLFFIDCNR